MQNPQQRTSILHCELPLASMESFIKMPYKFLDWFFKCLLGRNEWIISLYHSQCILVNAKTSRNNCSVWICFCILMLQCLYKSIGTQKSNFLSLSRWSCWHNYPLEMVHPKYVIFFKAKDTLTYEKDALLVFYVCNMLYCKLAIFTISAPVQIDFYDWNLILLVFTI